MKLSTVAASAVFAASTGHASPLKTIPTNVASITSDSVPTSSLTPSSGEPELDEAAVISIFSALGQQHTTQLPTSTTKSVDASPDPTDIGRLWSKLHSFTDAIAPWLSTKSGSIEAQSTVTVSIIGNPGDEMNDALYTGIDSVFTELDPSTIEHFPTTSPIIVTDTIPPDSATTSVPFRDSVWSDLADVATGVQGRQQTTPINKIIKEILHTYPGIPEPTPTPITAIMADLGYYQGNLKPIPVGLTSGPVTSPGFLKPYPEHFGPVSSAVTSSLPSETSSLFSETSSSTLTLESPILSEATSTTEPSSSTDTALTYDWSASTEAASVIATTSDDSSAAASTVESSVPTEAAQASESRSPTDSAPTDSAPSDSASTDESVFPTDAVAAATTAPSDLDIDEVFVETDSVYAQTTMPATETFIDPSLLDSDPITLIAYSSPAATGEVPPPVPFTSAPQTPPSPPVSAAAGLVSVSFPASQPTSSGLIPNPTSTFNSTTGSMSGFNDSTELFAANGQPPSVSSPLVAGPAVVSPGWTITVTVTYDPASTPSYIWHPTSTSSPSSSSSSSTPSVVTPATVTVTTTAPNADASGPVITIPWFTTTATCWTTLGIMEHMNNYPTSTTYLNTVIATASVSCAGCALVTTLMNVENGPQAPVPIATVTEQTTTKTAVACRAW